MIRSSPIHFGRRRKIARQLAAALRATIILPSREAFVPRRISDRPFILEQTPLGLRAYRWGSRLMRIVLALSILLLTCPLVAPASAGPPQAIDVDGIRIGQRRDVVVPQLGEVHLSPLGRDTSEQDTIGTRNDISYHLRFTDDGILYQIYTSQSLGSTLSPSRLGILHTELIRKYGKPDWMVGAGAYWGTGANVQIRTSAIPADKDSPARLVINIDCPQILDDFRKRKVEIDGNKVVRKPRL